MAIGNPTFVVPIRIPLMTPFVNGGETHPTLGVKGGLVIRDVRFVEVEEANETRNGDGQKSEDLLEGHEAHYQGQEQQKFDLEELENDEHWDDEFSELVTS